MWLLVSLLLALLFVVYAFVTINFFIKIRRYKIFGTTYIYIGFAYLVCLFFSLYANLNPVVPPETHLNPWVSVFSSFFDALKMMALSLDKALVSSYFNAGSYNLAFGIGYVLSSVLALIFTSLSVILSTIKLFGSKISTLSKRCFTKNDIFYIFADSKSSIALRFAEELKSNKKNIVVIFISRASQKTQEGTEYKDLLLSKAFDVRTENFSEGLCKMIFRNFGKKHRVFVYGLLSNDDDSLKLASNFTSAIEKNGLFSFINKKQSIDEEEINHLDNFKILINYYQSDFDINNNFSKKTLHIVNTLSQYDIVSTDFIMNNTIDKFVDFDSLDNEIDNDCFHVSFLGFGKVNKQIFKKMIQAYQLWSDNINKMHYHIGDLDSDSQAKANNNLYTKFLSNDSQTPFLYSVDSFSNGLDLTQYENLNSHIKIISKEKNRFSKKGFELFIVSASEQNNDIEIATLLRKSLLINLSEDRLSKTVIFVRIKDSVTAESFKKNNTEKHNDKTISYVLSQEEFNSYDFGNNKAILVPIVVFGEDSLISSFISNHYHVLDRLGVAAMKSYYGFNTLLEAKNAWLKMNKSETLANIETNYSLRAKLALFNYSVDSSYIVKQKDNNCIVTIQDFKKEIEGSGYPIINLTKPIFKLAALEHNRWLANSYLVYKYEPLSFDQFLAQNTVGKNFVPKKDNWTIEKGVKHVCMITNRGLLELNELICNKGKEFEKKANNLTFYTDIYAVSEVFSALAELQKKA